MYRQHGTEPACASCVHFGAEPGPRVDKSGKRYCPKMEWYTPPEGICNHYEREAGAD